MLTTTADGRIRVFTPDGKFISQDGLHLTRSGARYLATLPVVDTDTWVLVRQLESTPQGLPLEFWFYLKETDFVRYENIASQIFEHFIAVLPHFGLRLFQAPTGDDLRAVL